MFDPALATRTLIVAGMILSIGWSSPSETYGVEPAAASSPEDAETEPAGGEDDDPFADVDSEDDPFASPGTGEGGLLRSSSLSLSIFGNLDLASATERGDDTGFENGAVDLFLTSQLTDRWSFLVELVFETEPDTNELVADLERFRVAYDVSDLLRIELGRMHNSLVQWNVEHHHGLYMQTSASKPLMSEWEDDGGLWPVHVVGVRVSGAVHEALGFRYEVTVANGRGESLDDIQVGGDLNSDKALVLSFGVAPPKIPGLQLTATGYRDEVPDPAGALRELAYSASARYLASGLEVRGEWSRIEHERRATGETFGTHGFYALVSYRLPRVAASVRPYLLGERVDVAEDDSFFAGVEDVDALAAGVRWDLRPGVALKGEYRHEKVSGTVGVSDDQFRFQLAFGF